MLVAHRRRAVLFHNVVISLGRRTFGEFLFVSSDISLVAITSSMPIGSNVQVNRRSESCSSTHVHVYSPVRFPVFAYRPPSFLSLFGVFRVVHRGANVFAYFHTWNWFFVRMPLPSSRRSFHVTIKASFHNVRPAHRASCVVFSFRSCHVAPYIRRRCST